METEGGKSKGEEVNANILILSLKTFKHPLLLLLLLLKKKKFYVEKFNVENIC